jgi:predicted O-methyltransferase YrrM
MAFIVESDIEEYAAEHTTPPEPLLRELADETQATLRSPQMLTGTIEGRFLELLVHGTGAKRVLEIGTFTGYSSTAMALALPPDGRITCLDVSREWTDIARGAWTDAGVADRVDLRLAPATETLATLEDDAFDMAFVDADKPNYDAYYEGCLRVVRPGGLILLDNTLWSGEVADPTVTSENARILHALNVKIAADERVDHVLLPLADGLTLARVR